MYRSFGHYGWKPDPPDKRDFSYSAPEPPSGGLPDEVDLSTKCPSIFDQGALESCTGNAISSAFEFELLKQGLRDFTPSRLFIYYNERVLENTVPYDAGASIRDGMKSINAQGVCDETQWPYNIGEFAQRPYESCYQNASKNLAVEYSRLSQDIDQLKGCLAAGYPFVFGFTVYPSFESPDVTRTGIVSMPDLENEAPIGGHAVMAVGYNEQLQRFIVRNSWGPNWGMRGYCLMPYEYLLDNNLSDDFWTIRIVSEGQVTNHAITTNTNTNISTSKTMATEKTLTFEEVNEHVDKHLAARLASFGPGVPLNAGAFNICDVYTTVRPILVLASQAFFIPVNWRTAISGLITVLDGMCPQGK